jgi:short subunit dehydrogenase-like uncharacterized protein
MVKLVFYTCSDGCFLEHNSRPCIQACIENKAHYCDITAEAQYIQRTMSEFDEAAKANGVRIVHSCGLDSVPSEVMSLMAAHHMATEHDSALGQVTYVCEDSTFRYFNPAQLVMPASLGVSFVYGQCVTIQQGHTPLELAEGAVM